MNSITQIKIFFYNALRATKLLACHHVICWRSFTIVTLQFDHFHCHYIIVRQRFSWTNLECMSMYWTVQLSEIYDLENGNMSYERTNKYEWMNIKQSICLRCFHWCAFPCIPILWCHEKVVRQRISRHYLSSHCGDTTSGIIHLVLDRLLSLVTKEILHNAR
jgi:hypothetical protein